MIDALKPSFLKLVSWDWNRRVVVFPTDHAVLVSPLCEVIGCDHRAARRGVRLCNGCYYRWKKDGQPELDGFVHQPHQSHRSVDIGDCAVEGCPRPWEDRPAALCATHSHRRKYVLKLSLEEFLRHPEVGPLPSFGPCLAASCYRDRIGPRTLYCQSHGNRLRVLQRQQPVDEDRWQRTVSAVAVGGEVSLRGLPPLVVAEVLYGLQARTAKGTTTVPHNVRPVADLARAELVGSLLELDRAGRGKTALQVLTMFQKAVLRLGLTPETERHKDVWDLTAFGRTGTLDFRKISQPALREATKVWSYNTFPNRRGQGVRGTSQNEINAVARFSESLRLQREDRGLVLTALGRQDIVSYLNRLGFLIEAGKISRHKQCGDARIVRRVLNRWRTLGLTRAGEILEGLPADLSLAAEDMPDDPEDSEAGKDLPIEVMRQLCDRLDLLEQGSSREVRVAVEVLIDTGRRPAEASKLPYDCLERDPDGSWVLIYDNHKAQRLGRRLPIAQPTAELILNQQERVRGRFPGTPVADLALFPAQVSNRDGTKPLNPNTISGAHRAWVEALPEFEIPTMVEVQGQPVLKMVPFDKAKIFPYAYRHSYAQRHADARVDQDVLQRLMDHRQATTTQRYYRVRDERRREAVDRVTAMQFDRHGTRIWRDVQTLLDSERDRRSIGETEVPYGVCTEPSNVAAGGNACPLRFRCVGCGHFRTDVSYLPDLENYLSDLLRGRERLISTFDADEWARSEAMPSDEEIRRVRRLITRVKEDLDQLTPEEQAQIKQAVQIVRSSRSVLLGMPRVGLPPEELRGA
ncbi:site-specific integrase [Streptomyces sp. NPDC093018]|uniref:tyrosine-type recombinase/integrase n=1 Tax=Streptomyces sp. NPDC093018 TaxID=3155067 RepID=UPI00341E00AF